MFVVFFSKNGVESKVEGKTENNKVAQEGKTIDIGTTTQKGFDGNQTDTKDSENEADKFVAFFFFSEEQHCSQGGKDRAGVSDKGGLD